MKDFILVLGLIPDKTNEKDGMVQRELAIDKIFQENFFQPPSFAGQKRIYIETTTDEKWRFSIRGTIRYFKNKIEENKKRLDIFKGKEKRNVKFYRKINKEKFSKLCKNAKIIYVHSLYMTTLLSDAEVLKFKDKIIVDIHGCFIEELEYRNVKDPHMEEFKKREELAFRSAKALVAVSKNMIDFYKEKYKGIKTDFILLPIFAPGDTPVKTLGEKPKIIYSGGAQKWQNVDLMVESISKIANNFNVSILTPNVEEFKQKLKKAGTEGVEVKSVNSSELCKEYKNADFGYILRDDNVVNRVACPTKLIEYLTYGIIPVVLQPNIGDFNTLGYSYILNDDLVSGHIPSSKELSTMRQNNYTTLAKLNKIQKEGIGKLKEALLYI